ncbi:hypothetical protein B2J93_7381 [Marssonina coronariae]|uniref:LysM domain-containing protein n=1 Tax=Diplocarpon coronariae TaxID=2795749 RepID=A0A218Z751_9HELO|nr:hypothetical protein B2J93_7381 [Marssonina coronariae]
MSPEWLKASRPIFKIWFRRPNLATPDPQIAADFMEERGTKNSSQPQSVVMGEIYASGFVLRQRLEVMQFMASLSVRGAYRAESFPALKYLPLFLAPWKREIEHARSEADANMALIDDVKRSMVTANEKGQAAAPSVVPTLPAIQEEEANPPRGPYCQVTTIPSPLPQGLRDPPSYKVASASKPLPQHSVEPPPYSDVLPTYSSLTEQRLATPEKAFSSAVPADVLHFLDHENDSFTSLSFRYGVPISALRKANNVTSDHLLLARRTIVIPAEFYKGGVSLSPRPLEGEEEERRKGLVRRWMVACKVPDVTLNCRYDIAILYLNQADYDLNVAIEAYKKDERWGKEHPIEASVKGKGRRPDIGRRRFTGQR